MAGRKTKIKKRTSIAEKKYVKLKKNYSENLDPKPKVIEPEKQLKNLCMGDMLIIDYNLLLEKAMGKLH